MWIKVSVRWLPLDGTPFGVKKSFLLSSHSPRSRVCDLHLPWHCLGRKRVAESDRARPKPIIAPKLRNYDSEESKKIRNIGNVFFFDYAKIISHFNGWKRSHFWPARGKVQANVTAIKIWPFFKIVVRRTAGSFMSCDFSPRFARPAHFNTKILYDEISCFTEHQISIVSESMTRKTKFFWTWVIVVKVLLAKKFLVNINFQCRLESML